MPTAPPTAYTPFPNHLLDRIMPALSDTAWRVLCVIARQTLGWEDENSGERKRQDWLTQSQLKARTGRASEAVSRAVEALVQAGIIEVCSEDGERLDTPQQRRRCPGRMLFRLTSGTLETPANVPEPNTVRPCSDTEAGCSQTEAGCSQTEAGCSQTEAGCSQTELRFAKTTKETQNKTTPSGVRVDPPAFVEKPGDNPCSSASACPQSRADLPAASDVKRFLLAYRELFARQSAQGEPPPMSWGRDGKLVKGLLAQYGYDRLLELLTRYFASEDAWVKKRGYALACFPTLLPTLLMEPSSRPKRGADAPPVVIHSDVGQQWQHAEAVAVSDKSLFERFPELRRKVRAATT